MQKRDAEFALDFARALEVAYADVREYETTPMRAVEMLKWTGELVGKLR